MNSLRITSATLLAVCCIFAAAITWAAEPVTPGTVVAIELSSDPRGGFASSHGATALATTIGGAVGYQAGGNRNAAAAGAVGAALGAIAGNQIDSRRRGRSTHSIVVQLDRGDLVAITDPRPSVQVGSRVYVIGGNRVIAAPSAARGASSHGAWR